MTYLFIIIELCLVFLMDTSLLGDDVEGEEGYLSHTLQSIVWDQEDILLSFMALYNQ
jgi:hypothetical protein